MQISRRPGRHGVPSTTMSRSITENRRPLGRQCSWHGVADTHHPHRQTHITANMSPRYYSIATTSRTDCNRYFWRVWGDRRQMKFVNVEDSLHRKPRLLTRNNFGLTTRYIVCNKCIWTFSLLEHSNPAVLNWFPYTAADLSLTACTSVHCFSP